MVRIKWHSRRGPGMIMLLMLAALIMFGAWLAGAFRDAGGSLERQSASDYDTASGSVVSEVHSEQSITESAEPEAPADSAAGPELPAIIETGNSTDASSGEPSTSDKEASSVTEAEWHEPTVKHASAESSDGQFRIETYGTNRGVTAGGLYPAEAIRIVNIDNDQTEWSMPGYYEQSFLWSPDSRYVSVYYMARTWGETIVIDTNDWSQIALPTLDELRNSWNGETTVHEVRADPYMEAAEWLDDTRLSVNVKWSGAGNTEYSGTYIYDVLKRE